MFCILAHSWRAAVHKLRPDIGSRLLHRVALKDVLLPHPVSPKTGSLTAQDARRTARRRFRIARRLAVTHSTTSRPIWDCGRSCKQKRTSRANLARQLCFSACPTAAAWRLHTLSASSHAGACLTALFAENLARGSLPEQIAEGDRLLIGCATDRSS